MKKKTSSKVLLVQTGDISNIPGSVNIAGGDIKTQQKISIHYDVSSEVVSKVLASALAQAKKRPKTSHSRRADIEKEVKEIESELGKRKADKSFLSERFSNIARMAPDILEVIIAGLGSPAAGLALTMKKIAEKAKAEAEKVTAKE